MNACPFIEAEKRCRRNVKSACELLKVSRADGSGPSPDRCRPGWDSRYFFPFLVFLVFLVFLATRITPLPDSGRSTIC